MQESTKTSCKPANGPWTLCKCQCNRAYDIENHATVNNINQLVCKCPFKTMQRSAKSIWWHWKSFNHRQNCLLGCKWNLKGVQMWAKWTGQSDRSLTGWFQGTIPERLLGWWGSERLCSNHQGAMRGVGLAIPGLTGVRGQKTRKDLRLGHRCCCCRWRALPRRSLTAQGRLQRSRCNACAHRKQLYTQHALLFRERERAVCYTSQYAWLELRICIRTRTYLSKMQK